MFIYFFLSLLDVIDILLVTEYIAMSFLPFTYQVSFVLCQSVCFMSMSSKLLSWMFSAV